MIVLKTTSSQVGWTTLLPTSSHVASTRFQLPYQRFPLCISRSQTATAINGAWDAPYARSLIINRLFFNKKPVRFILVSPAHLIMDQVPTTHQSIQSL